VKKLICCLIFGIFLIWSCDTQKPSSAIPFHVCKHYGAPVSYSEGSHPGIDFEISQGTPIIAVTEGEVSFVGGSDPKVSFSGGIFVRSPISNFLHVIKDSIKVRYPQSGTIKIVKICVCIMKLGASRAIASIPSFRTIITHL